MNDRRIPLEEGTELNIESRKIRIGHEVGRGANCIVYDAVYTDQSEIRHNVRIKECYPIYLSLERKNDKEILSKKNEDEAFHSAKERFRMAYQKNAEIRSIAGLVNSTINAADLFFENGTCYTIMPFDEGDDYRNYSDTSLKELFEHILSLAKLIRKYHENGYLYLDIKPENVLIIPETNEHIYLFDFDSVVTLEELRGNAQYRLSFSDGFSAPEQVQGKIKDIGCHTDIYAIGALVFYKIFGRKPDPRDCTIAAKFDFSKIEGRYQNNRYQPVLFKKIAAFLKKTLTISVHCRWKEVQQLIDAVSELIHLSDIEGAFIYDSFRYNSDCFIGRVKEIENIHEKLENQQLVFLSGIGGIGKTETAKKYAKEHRKFYNTIVFSVFDSSIKNLVLNEIKVNGINQDEEEDDEAYFERKLRILKETLSPDDLIIIDNFDVESDDTLERILECPCKFIITTREDFRDYNYPQINIDRMESEEEILQVFRAYNDTDYTDSEFEAIKKIIDIVDRHTMTVELIAKYLRDTGDSVECLYHKFLENKGIMNTGETEVRQRKDKEFRKTSINNHIRLLFDVSGFSASEKEIISSLSLFGNIRISKDKFEEICVVDDISSKINGMIKRGWIEITYDNFSGKSGKISLHQIIQDLIYNDFKPDTGNCPHIAKGMQKFIETDSENYTIKQIKRQVFDIFMERITGTDFLYVNLCLAYGKKDKLEEAEKICLESKEKDAWNILQKIYCKKIVLTIDMDDAMETDMDLDEYVKEKLTEISVMLQRAKESCEKYSDDPEYLARTYIEIANETDTFFQAGGDGFWVLPSGKDRFKELDDAYFQIFDMLELAAQNIFKAEISADEKEKLLMKIRDFYTEKDLMATYRVEHFADPEKAYWYQQEINNLRKETTGKNSLLSVTIDGNTTYLYSDDITNDNFASYYEEKGEYEKAIELYEKSYLDKGDNYAYYNIANVCKKAGWTKRAIDYLKYVLELDKKYIKRVEDYHFYSNYACHDLVDLLISQKCYNEAKQYANELLYYNMFTGPKEDNIHKIRWIIAANYQLYEIEKDIEQKNFFWEECIKYYRIIEGGKNISENISDFIIAYIKKMDVSDEMFEEINSILDRLESRWLEKTEKEIIEYAINTCEKNEKYVSWHIKFLIQYALIFLNRNQNYSEALYYCELAQKIYNQYKLDNLHCQNMIYKIMSEIMSHINEYDFEQVQEARKRCDYALLAEEDIKEVSDSCEDIIKIWKDAANSYHGIEFYEQEVFCLKNALKIIVEDLNQHEYSSYDNYWNIAHSLVTSYINMKRNEEAYQVMEEMYLNTLDYYSNKMDDNDIWVLQIIALIYLFEDIHCFKEAVDMCFYGIYVTICVKPNTDLIGKVEMQDTERNRLYKNLRRKIMKNVDTAMIDTIVELKDEIVFLSEKTDIGHNYMDLVQLISKKYENSEIEFKR